jgi:predicted nuclease with TOPRIM domain
MKERTEFEKTMDSFNEMLKKLPEDQIKEDRKFDELEKAINAAETMEERQRLLDEFKKINER